MVSLTIFGISLAGLIVLFALKSFELSRNAHTPLAHIRKFGDPLVANGSRQCAGACRMFSQKAAETGAAWLRMTAHNMRTSFDALMHACAARLNRYLRGRRPHIRQNENGHVSAHLKTVLQKEENTTPPDIL